MNIKTPALSSRCHTRDKTTWKGVWMKNAYGHLKEDIKASFVVDFYCFAMQVSHHSTSITLSFKL